MLRYVHISYRTTTKISPHNRHHLTASQHQHITARQPLEEEGAIIYQGRSECALEGTRILGREQEYLRGSENIGEGAKILGREQ